MQSTNLADNFYDAGSHQSNEFATRLFSISVFKAFDYFAKAFSSGENS